MATPQWQVVGQSDLPGPPPGPSAGGGWNVVGQSDLTPPPETFGGTLKGEGDLLATGAANIIPSVANAADDFLRYLSGQPARPAGSPAVKPWAHLGESGTNLVQTVSQLPGGHDAKTGAPLTIGQDVSDSLGRTKQAAETVAEQDMGLTPSNVQNVERVGGDVAQLYPAADVAGGAVEGVGNAIADAAQNSADQQSEWYKLGLRNGSGHPIARQVAGDSAREAVAGHNQQIGQAVAASEAGHPAGEAMSYESLADARAPANAVYNRVANALPTGQLDPDAKAAIQNAGLPEGGRMSQGSPQAQEAIAKLQAQLTDPNKQFTGQQMVNELRGLRQEGFTNAASEDVSNQQLGRAQLDMARAIESHIGNNLPANGDVDLAQFQDARQQLAKNWAVQGILRGGDVDLKALARLQRNNPEQLTGGLKVLADFANGEGKNVVGIPDTFNPPGVARDLAGIINWHRPVQSTLQAIPGVGSAARALLTGDTGAAVENARGMFPGVPPERFAPLEPQPPTAPNYTTATGAMPPAAAPTQRPSLGDLADVLSQGVGERPPAGLSSGPMGSPAGEGLTYRGSPEVYGAQAVHGGSPALKPRFQDDYGNEVNPNAPPPNPRVQLGDRFAVPAGTSNADVAGVRSQGVPNDEMQRTAPQPAVQHEVDEDTGAHTVTSANGETHGQESGPYLIVKRSDTAASAQGTGEGTARMEAMLQQAEHRGLQLASDISVSPAQQRVYAALARKGYRVIQNPNAAVSPTTGNLVSDDIRKPVFVVRSPLAMAVGQ